MGVSMRRRLSLSLFLRSCFYAKIYLLSDTYSSHINAQIAKIVNIKTLTKPFNETRTRGFHSRISKRLIKLEIKIAFERLINTTVPEDRALAQL